MNTIDDLRSALADNEHRSAPDLDTIITAGRRRRHRRRAGYGLAAGLVAAGVVAGGVSLGGDAATPIVSAADIRAGNQARMQMEQAIDDHLGDRTLRSTEIDAWGPTMPDGGGQGTYPAAGDEDLAYLQWWNFEYDVLDTQPDQSLYILVDYTAKGLEVACDPATCTTRPGPDGGTVSVERRLGAEGRELWVSYEPAGSAPPVTVALASGAGCAAPEYAYSVDDLVGLATDPRMTFPEPLPYNGGGSDPDTGSGSDGDEETTSTAVRSGPDCN